MLAASIMAPSPEASEMTPQQAIQPNMPAQIPLRFGLLPNKKEATPAKSVAPTIVAPSTALRTPWLRFSSQVFSRFGALVFFLPAFEGSWLSASAKARALRSPPHARQNLSLSTNWAAHWGQYITATSYSFRPGEIECPGIRRAGEEANEFFVVGASDPIEDAPVIFAEVYSPFEHHGLADLPAFHLDRVFVGASAIAFKDGFPDIVFTLDLGVEFLTDVLGRGCALRRVVNAPCPGPYAGDVGGGVFGLRGLRVLVLGKCDADARDQHRNEQG